MMELTQRELKLVMFVTQKIANNQQYVLNAAVEREFVTALAKLRTTTSAQPLRRRTRTIPAPSRFWGMVKSLVYLIMAPFIVFGSVVIIIMLLN